MRKLYYKKIFILLMILVLTTTSICYSKDNPFATEVEKPVAESKNNVSEGTIIFDSPYNAYNPLNPVKVGVNQEEYEKVDNYNIDLKTLGLRIKYFSPRYTNIKQSALSSYYMAYYARGGNDTLTFDAKGYTSEILDLSNEYKLLYEKYLKERDALDKNDPNYSEKYATLTAQIETYKLMYNGAKTTYDTTNKTINSTKSMLGLGRALYNIGNVDNNTGISSARRQIEKGVSTAILSYLQLKTYVSILEKQSNLYYDIYKLNLKNYDLGIATSIDVSDSLSTYENAKVTMQETKTTMQNVKEQIANNLGYKLSDIDKLVFVEPEVDIDYIKNINLDEDRKRACTSNSSYVNISLNDKDRKLPQSTGENILNQRLKYVSEKVTSEVDNLYDKLQSALIVYESNVYLNEIFNTNIDANKRKFDNKLVSEIEYKGLELQNLATNLQMKVAKYDLISASNEYYYATLGNLSIK